MSETILQEPEGIAFFSIKTGETMYAKLEPTIAAFINSSDMGVNASRGQDYGWRLDPEWVKKIRAFRADEDAMDRLAAKLRLEDGQVPSTTQILYYIYGRQVRAYLQRLQEYDNPFEEQYQQAISTNPNHKAAPQAQRPMPTHLARAAEDENVTEFVDEADLMPDDDEEDDEPASAPVEHTEADEPTQPATEPNSTQSASSRKRNKRNTN